MPRLALRLEFDGAGFCGWQMQAAQREAEPGHLTAIQSEVERALALCLRSKDRIIVQGCGRTDAGVHAFEFFAHADVEGTPDLERLRHGMNGVLPSGIAVTQLGQAPPSFHALDSVLSKTYEYHVLLRRAKPTLDRGRCLWLPIEPARFKMDLLRGGLAALIGKHDFKAFQAAHATVQTTVRTLFDASCSSHAEASGGLRVVISFTGDGFLKHQVRTMVGTLLEVAQGRRDLSTLAELLRPEASRTQAGFCAPAEGLYLRRVVYEAP